MKATQQLNNLGQSLWLDNITRDLLDSGTLRKYIEELSVTGLTSNPTIFDHAIKNSTAYDGAIRMALRKGAAAEALFFNLALEDITRAADLFQRFISVRTVPMAGSRLKYLPWLRMTPPAPSPRRKTCMRAPSGPTCSSKSPVRTKESQLSRRRSSTAFR